MSRRALPFVLPFVVLGAACGPASAPRTPAPTSTRAPTPVPAGYADADARTLREGRAVLQLLLDDKRAELRASMSAELAALVSDSLLEKFHEELAAAGSVSRGDDASFLLQGARAYAAMLHIGEELLGANMVLDEQGTVVSLNFVPRATLPPDPHADRALKTRMRLPFEGQWWVFWGGDNEIANYHVVSPDQRHAFDLAMWKDGGTHRGDGKQNEDYYCWGQPIVAPADATVVAVVGDKPDNAPGAMDPSAPAGNHVVLDFGNGEFALLAHLQQGSVAVKVGDKVTAGQRLGLTGNSGNTSEPHLHFHVQDGPKLFGAAGVPVQFQGVCTDGKAAAAASPVHGQFIEDCE